MKVLGITFSARKQGNCLRSLIYCLKKFSKTGFKVEALNAYNLNIKPCSQCNYECLKKSDKMCPHDDDVKMIYNKIMEADIVLYSIPGYAGHPSGLYRAWFERGKMMGDEEYKQSIQEKPRGYIVVSNLSSQGDQVLHEIQTEFYNLKNKPPCIFLDQGEFNVEPGDLNLIEFPEVRSRLDRFIERIKSNLPENGVFSNLLSAGITKETAQELIENFPVTKIKSQLEALPYRKSKDPASILVRSIRENWSSPAGYAPQKR